MRNANSDTNSYTDCNCHADCPRHTETYSYPKEPSNAQIASYSAAETLARQLT